MNSVTDFIKLLGPARLAAMGAVAVGLVGFFIFLMLRVSQPQLSVLFTDLTFDDSAEIVRKLEGMNVPYELRQDGSIILAPKDRVLRLRMELAESGLPSGGTVGYELFDKSDTLGATSFVQNINRLRAIEGELSRTIRSLQRVRSARVHLVLPQRKLFSRQNNEPSASIVVDVLGELEHGQIKSIQHLVASAVEGLKPGRVSIVNEAGALLASGAGEDSGIVGTEMDERTRAIENRMQNDIQEIVSSVVGDGRVRVRVAAEMDYSKVTETSDTYDPDGRVLRSSQTREENTSASHPANNEAVSVGNELPAANPPEEGQAGNQSEATNTSEEIVNYEISRTTKTEVAEGGRIKRLSVAVLVDGIYQKSADGNLTYARRPQEQIESIAALVKSAIGYNKERGDQVHVANMQFVENDLPAPAQKGETGWASSLMSMSKDAYFRIAELAVIAIVSLLVLLLVIRPLVRRIITPDETPRALEGPDRAGAAQLGAPAQQDAVAELPPPSAASQALKNAKVVGEVQAKAVEEVGQAVKSNPSEAVTIVRNWIHQSA